MESNKKSTFRVILIIFASILFYMMLQKTNLLSGWVSYIGQILSPIIIGIILAFIINIPLRFFENTAFAPLNKRSYKWWNVIRRPVCLLLSLVVFLGIITLVICLIIPEVKNTIVSLITSFPDFAERVIAKAEDVIVRLNIPMDFPTVLEKIDWASFSKSLLAGISDTGSTVIATTIEVTTDVIGGLFDVVVGVALSLYILGSKEKLLSHAKRLILAIFPSSKSKRVLDVMRMAGEIFTSFITGQLTEALLIGVFCYIGMSIFGMPYAVMVSATISVTALIPVFGAFVGTVFGALMILFVSPIKAVAFVIFIIIIQQIDNNFIYPRIVGSSVGLPGIWVLCAVTVGGSMFGAIGMLLGVPVCAVAYCLVREFVLKKEAQMSETVADDGESPN